MSNMVSSDLSPDDDFCHIDRPPVERCTNMSNVMTRATPMGHPLPTDEHACSVSLPTWDSIVGYEEGDPHVVSAMQLGYPRFVYHPYVVKLMQLVLEMCRTNNIVSPKSTENDTDCLVLPSRRSALRCRDFLIRAHGREDSERLSSPDNAFDYDDENDIGAEEGLVVEMSPCSATPGGVCVVDLGTKAGVHAVVFPRGLNDEGTLQAKAYWQHTGEVVSSRLAEATMAELGQKLCCQTRLTSHCRYHAVPVVRSHENNVVRNNLKELSLLSPSSSPCGYRASLRQRIGSIVGVDSDNVFLAPSGMAAIYQSLRSARRRRPSGKAVVYGFPYLDTLKMCSRPELVPGGFEFFGRGDERDLSDLRTIFAKLEENNEKPGEGRVAAVLTEFPSNPLLNCHDLEALRRLCDDHGTALIVDDTISNFANVDLLRSGLADVTCTSLTKLFNGRGDAMAGSAVCNPTTELGQWMARDLKEHWLCGKEDGDDLYVGDAAAVLANSEDFLERSHAINITAEALADFLQQRPEVHRVYYPKFAPGRSRYDAYLAAPVPGRHYPGYGGLLSLDLAGEVCHRTVYNTLSLAKGPSLGTNFTLVCPYTLLAHYHELDFARSYNVEPDLIRVAVGLEDLSVLIDTFDRALVAGAAAGERLSPSSFPHSAPKIAQRRGYCTTPLRSHLHKMFMGTGNVSANTTTAAASSRSWCNRPPVTPTASAFVRRALSLLR